MIDDSYVHSHGAYIATPFETNKSYALPRRCATRPSVNRWTESPDGPNWILVTYRYTQQAVLSGYRMPSSPLRSEDEYAGMEHRYGPEDVDHLVRVTVLIRGKLEKAPHTPQKTTRSAA